MPKDITDKQTMIFLNGPEFAPPYAVLIPQINEEAGPQSGVLLSGEPEVTFVRISDQEFELDIPAGWFELTSMAFKPTRSYKVGEKSSQTDYSTEILAVTADGQPSRVRFAMRKALEHPDYRWMVWKGLHYEEVTLDSQIGKPVHYANPLQELLD